MEKPLLIGSGTAFPKSSQIGESISGQINIIGDFEVDQPFVIKNAIINIASGVRITVKASPNGTDNGSTLDIYNSKLFACKGLWKGISVGFLASLGTWDYTEIEDAEVAVYAGGLSSLSFDNTIFNRNRVGIELLTPFPNAQVSGPLVWVFSHNQFTCTAPINESENEIGYVGVKLTNATLITTPDVANIFAGLQYGIYATGSASFINASDLEIKNMTDDGIYMSHGNLLLTKSSLTDCGLNAVNILKAQNISIKKTSITLTDELPDIAGLSRNGVAIRGFYLNSRTDLAIDFNCVLNQAVGYFVRGVYLKGGVSNVGADSRVAIYESIFNMRALGSTLTSGIDIDDFFPESSQVDIYNNDFDIAGFTYVPSTVYGIRSNGVKNNFHIYDNRFSHNWAGASERGIELRGSTGINNDVKSNKFFPNPQIATDFLLLSNFHNTEICLNELGSIGVSSGFIFSSTNAGTTLTGNTIYATGAAVKLTNALIGPQSHKGNEWRPVSFEIPCPFNPALTCTITYRSFYHAICNPPTSAPDNLFKVHTQQSVWNAATEDYTYFSEFHPENVSPDIANEFFSQESGSPSINCLDRFSGPGGVGVLERNIAGDQISTDNEAMIWSANAYLYKKLMRNPSFLDADPAFRTFVNKYSKTDIGLFYAVENQINSAHQSDPATRKQAALAQAEIQRLLMEIKETQTYSASVPSLDFKTAVLKKQSDLMAQQAQYLTSVDNDGKYSQLQLKEAREINQRINPLTLAAQNQKLVHSIALDPIPELSNEERAQLKAVAIQDPVLGGGAVEQAIGMLPVCEMVGIPDYISKQITTEAPVSSVASVEERSAKIAENGTAWVFPNPAGSTFSIQVPDSGSGELVISDLNGKVRMNQKIQYFNGQKEITHALENGIYLIRFCAENGQCLTAKLVILK